MGYGIWRDNNLEIFGRNRPLIVICIDSLQCLLDELIGAAPGSAVWQDETSDGRGRARTSRLAYSGADNAKRGSDLVTGVLEATEC